MTFFDLSHGISQLFWLSVTFCGVLFFIWYVIIPRLDFTFQRRVEFFEQNSQESENLSLRIKKIEEKRHAKLTKAREEASLLLAQQLEKFKIERQEAIDLLRKSSHQSHLALQDRHLEEKEFFNHSLLEWSNELSRNFNHKIRSSQEYESTLFNS